MDDDRGSSSGRLAARDDWNKWAWLVPVLVVAGLAVAYVLLKGPLRDAPGGGVADTELDVEAFEEDNAGDAGSPELGSAVDGSADEGGDMDAVKATDSSTDNAAQGEAVDEKPTEEAP